MKIKINNFLKSTTLNLLKIILFIFCLFFLITIGKSFKIKTSHAQSTPQPRCGRTYTINYGGDTVSKIWQGKNRCYYYQGLLNMGAVGQELEIQSDLYSPGDNVAWEIIDSYIYTGSGTCQKPDFINTDAGYNSFTQHKRTTYNEAKDYRVTAWWKYRILSTGEIGSITCEGVIRTFDREVKSYGTKTLTYPKATDTVTITGQKPYIGFVSGGGWEVNRLGARWDLAETSEYGYLSSPNYLNLPCLFYTQVDYPKALPSQFVVNLSAPSRNYQNGAYSNYKFDNLLIYSRNDPGTLIPPSSPYCFVTPTSTPISTFVSQIPTSTNIKNPYCSSFGFYPYGPYQDKGGNGNTDSLPNTYSKYVSFTAPFTGKVNGLAVKAGNWGGAWRTISCKITNTNGTVNISQEASASAFRSDSSVQWRKIAFSTQFDLTGGQQYRLYCRGSDSGMVYWIYDPTKNANNDLAKLYGKTYAVCMQ